MIEVGYMSHEGMRRTNNEDACGIMPDQGIYIVADGVGGSLCGEVASNTAIREIKRFVGEYSLPRKADVKQIYEFFYRCMESVNIRIFKDAQAGSQQNGMATTVVVCCIRDGMAYFISAGDSRAYIQRMGRLRQITEDHTYVNELLAAGIITPEEAENHSKKHVITRALGAEDTVEPDFRMHDILPGDRVLLCTDGLHGELTDEEIEEIMTEDRSMAELAYRLVESANIAGGADNVTVICLEIQGGSDER